MTKCIRQIVKYIIVDFLCFLWLGAFLGDECKHFKCAINQSISDVRHTDKTRTLAVGVVSAGDVLGASLHPVCCHGYSHQPHRLAEGRATQMSAPR